MLDRPAGPSNADFPAGRALMLPRSLAAADNTFSYARLLTALRRRCWALLACIVLTPLLGFIAISRTTPLYTATGALIYDPSEYKLRELQSILRVDPTTEAVMASQAEILRSLRVASRVAERGNLFSNPEFNPALRPPSLKRRAVAWLQDRLGLSPPPAEHAAYGPNQDDDRNATLLAVQSALDARPVHYSRVIEVSFTAQDRQVAATAVNNAMDIYIKDQYAAKHKAVDVATQWLEKRADELRRQVRDGEDRIAEYRARQGLAQGMHAAVDAERITHITEELVRARAELANIEAKLDAARGRAGSAVQAAIAPSVVQLRAQQGQLAAQLQAQQARLGASHPDLRGLRGQLAEVQRAVGAETARVVAATEGELRAARERVAALQADLQTAEQDANRNREAEIPLNAMLRDVEASRAQLQAVLERIQQTAQQAAIESSEAHEISQALPPTRPSWPRVMPMMSAAGAAGLLFGGLLVYLLELADTSLCSGEDARAAIERPCFALLPEISRRHRGALQVDEYAARKPVSAFAEQLRALRAALWLGSERPYVLAVTAARAGEGKTTVTLALGRAAALGGERALVVECDLRRPAFSRLLRQKAAPAGLADCLRGKAQPQDVIQREAQTGLDVIEAGRVGTDVLDLFLSGAMEQILTALRQDYDLILLDSPPAQAMTEARIVAGLADATLLCVRWRSTPRRVLQHAVERLEEARARVTGSVLTRVDAHAHLHSGYADADVYHRRR